VPSPFLHPADADAVADFARGNAGADFHNFADGFVPEHARERQAEQTVSKMHVGVAEAAGVNFHDHLVRARGGRLPFLYFPFAVYGGDDCRFHRDDSEKVGIHALDARAVKEMQVAAFAGYWVATVDWARPASGQGLRGNSRPSLP
jgi:hypothetical protein